MSRDAILDFHWLKYNWAALIGPPAGEGRKVLGEGGTIDRKTSPLSCVSYYSCSLRKPQRERERERARERERERESESGCGTEKEKAVAGPEQTGKGDHQEKAILIGKYFSCSAEDLL